MKDWSNGDLRRAIREGTGPGRETLVFIASQSFKHIHTEDVRSVIAYLRSQPAVAKGNKKVSISPIGVLIVSAGAFAIPPVPPQAAPAPE